MTPTDNLEAGAGDLVERTPSGETVAGMTVLGWMTEVDVPGIGPLRRTVYHWSTPDTGQKVIRLVDAAEAAAQLAAVTAENARLREALEPFANWPCERGRRDNEVFLGSTQGNVTFGDFRRARSIVKRPVKFRWHRGGLAASMETVVEVANLAALVEIINDGGVHPGKIEIKPYAFDERIGWDTHIVTVDGNAVGFTDGGF